MMSDVEQRSTADKPTLLDYLLMFGAPVAFVVVLVIGVTMIVGPAPVPTPIGKIKQGAVRNGMSVIEVESTLGLPKGREDKPDGGFTYRYQGATAEPWVVEDGYVDFNSDGYVIGTTVERITVRPPGEDR